MVKKIETEKDKSKIKKTFIFHAIITIIFLCCFLESINLGWGAFFTNDNDDDKILIITLLVSSFFLYLQSPINISTVAFAIVLMICLVGVFKGKDELDGDARIAMISLLLYIVPSFTLYFGNIKGYKLYPIKDILKS